MRTPDTWARRIWRAIRGALWPIPVIGVVVAIGLGIALPALDEALEDERGQSPLTFVFGGGPAAARDVLSSISGSLISVTGLVFSLTVVALQLSSSQYSPRVLQTFVTDRVVQLTLGQLVLTFVYALTVLRTVRTESATSGSSAFVPRLSVTVGYLLTLGSVVALLLFLGHLTRSLRVETMLRDVHDEAMRTYDEELGSEPDASVPPAPPGVPVRLAVGSSGFLVGLDEARIARAAAEAGAVVLLDPRIGDAVLARVPVAHVWVPPGKDLDPLQRALEDGLRLAHERTSDRDIAYSLRKIVDIAVRALSPGVNDPTTAVHALSHVSALLADLAHRPLGPAVTRDEDGDVRLVVPQYDFPALVRLGLEEVLQYAEGSPAVLRRVAGVLRELAWRAPRDRARDCLPVWSDRLGVVAGRTADLSASEVRQWRDDVEDALAGRWEPTWPSAPATRERTLDR
ncbi:DUF2254 domain-containing protein [Klenkia sp. PcliD-1-E]|uniref:DUF2254 domain-containing protein n=1 Tax=Klenkia sp. PcliD-1-E TaxID=2954492 RepID=UPI002096D1A6|nr:DUF2254 domain-containing protein [Klenkia sp. PcliD-1-E]MCO7221484.1 DUF2254 domain-containing protein [Klenkia sp. PcliD-1-E]